MKLIIGLTGGIGSGKSTVAALFKKLSISVVDADKVARDVVQKGQPALGQISAHFGADILMEGELNRAKLRQIIFSDTTKKDWLNALLHPLIRTKILADLAKAQGDYVILEAALLFENDLQGYCDRVIVVDIEQKEQIKRASARDNNAVSQIKRIIDAQIGRKQRLQKSDFVIDNSAVSLRELEMLVISLDKRLKAL